MAETISAPSDFTLLDAYNEWKGEQSTRTRVRMWLYNKRNNNRLINFFMTFFKTVFEILYWAAAATIAYILLIVIMVNVDALLGTGIF